MKQANAVRKPKQTAIAQALEGAMENRGLKLVSAAEAAKPPVEAKPQGKIMVLDGSAGEVDAVAFARVTPLDILTAGTTLKALAMNLLAGRYDPALNDPKAPCWSHRSVKDAKTAFFKLIQHSANTLREAWAKDQATRKAKANGRLTPVSLSGLAKLFKTPVAGGRVSPYQALQQTANAAAEQALEHLAKKQYPQLKKILTELRDYTIAKEDK